MTASGTTRQEPPQAAANDTAKPVARRGRPPKDATAIAGRRAQILAAATRRFAKVGFLGTTVRQIADDVSILSGSLYHHFTNKEEMLDAIVRDTVLRMQAVATQIASRPASAEVRLISLIQANLADLKDNLDVHAILYREREFFRQREDFAYVITAKKAGYQAWERILLDGIREGAFRSNLDTFLTISTVVRMLNSAADWFSGEASGVVDSTLAYPVASVAEFFVAFILQAIRRIERVAEPVPEVPQG